MFVPEETSMSTLERMLKVLRNRDGASRDGLFANILSSVFADSRSGTGRRAGRRTSTRRGRRRATASVAGERLEQRQLLAVTTFSEASISNGWVTIVAEGGDNVFIQQNAGNPHSIRIADNSSFTNSTVVGGPVGLGGASQQLAGVDINAIKTLNITSGTLRRDAEVYARGYPMVEPNVTRFALSGNYLRLSDWDGTRLNGQLSIVQPDGRTEYWKFTQLASGRQPTFTTGIGIDTSPKPGDYYPTSIYAWDGLNPNGLSEIEVRWNVAQLPLTSVPVLEDVQWINNPSGRTFGPVNVRESVLRPASPETTFIPLPHAAGLGLNEIIASTYQSTLVIQGITVNVTTSGSLATPNQLMFNGKPAHAIYNIPGYNPPVTHFVTGRLVTGVDDPVYGTERGIELTMSGECAVQLKSARYAMPGGGDPVTATIFNGQDLHAAVNVNLVQPGSTFNLDSPLHVNTGNGGITLRATNVNFNAEASTKEDLTIGAAVVSSAQAWERATAIAQIVDGKVRGVEIPSGWGGAGFDADDPPTVTIAVPAGQGGTAAIAVADVDASTTRIVRIRVIDGGTGYTETPSVQIAAPPSVFNAARPLAKLSAEGQVSSIAFQAGAKLEVRITGVDTTGAVTSAIVLNNGGGQGYSVGDVVVIDSSAGGIGQSAQFRLLEVNSVGGAVRIEVYKGGKGYGRDEVLTHAGAEGRGYGYKVAPRVWISRPDSPDGVRAEATATIDSLGRIKAIEVTNKGSGYSTAAPPTVTIAAVTTSAQAESVRLNARIAAANYSFTLADEPMTPDVTRSTLRVSNTGSLAGSLDGSIAASTVMIESRQGDVLLEGLVNATKQSFTLQSNPEDQWLKAFRLTTKAEGSSVPTGLIKGDVVAVTLANDLETPKGGAVAYSEVELQTEVNSLRVRASRRNGAELVDPFPYQLTVAEKDAITIDSVASSSFPIDLSSANGSITLRAAVATAGGLVITTPKAGFDVTAPVSTTKGQIEITAQSISVGSSLQVTDSDTNEAHEDIVLRSTDGDVIMNGGVVSGRNRVAIKQEKRDPLRKDFTAASTKIPIASGGKATMQLTVPVGLSVNDINVTVSATHTNVGLLSAVLIAPDGTRVRLFNRFDVSGAANMVNTTFDSEAASPLRNTAVKAPFTAAFQPVDSLSQLYFKPTGGTWTLEVADSFSGTPGTLDGFSMSFADPAGKPGGMISGTSLIRANTLSIDAEGSVGKPGGGPLSPGFYLQTDVDTLIGYCLGSFAVWDVNDLDVNSLGAGGLVSLRADGVDRVVDGTTGQALAEGAALRGNLRDVTAFEVSAPNGSISLDVNTANDIILGNAANLALAKTIRDGLQPAMRAAGSVRITAVGNSTGGSFKVLDAPLAGSSAKQARFAMTVTGAQATYDAREPGRYAATITAKLNESLVGALPNVRRGDRILINNAADTVATPNARQMNGIYAVTALGDKDAPWQLTRVPDGDTADELLSNTIVAVNDGSGAASIYYRIAYPALGTTLFGAGDMTVVKIVSPQGSSLVSTSIGSNDSTDSVDFVVATNDGSNESPGSLGKMIRLRQENVPVNDQEMNFLFASAISKDKPIGLEQELPIITKAFAIDGKSRYDSVKDEVSTSPEKIAIDGSRIRTTRYGDLVGLKTAANGLVFGSSSSGASLSNITIGGFNQQDEVDPTGKPVKLSAAIIVDGASNVTMDGIVVGEDGLGARLGSVHGIVVRNAGGALDGAVSSGVTIKNSTISAAAVAGVSLEDGTADALLYGNTIGYRSRDNGIGIEVVASGANNVIGSVTPDEDTKNIPGVNTISFNTIGIKLAGTGGTTVVNSEIASNNRDGILITAGTNVIGGETAPDPLKPLAVGANRIVTNKGWGVNIQAATVNDATTLAKAQKIFGNYFVVPGTEKNITSNQNQAFKVRPAPAAGEDTAIGVSASTPGAVVSLYQGETVTGQVKKTLEPYPAGYITDRKLAGLDPSGNQHFGVGDNLGPSLSMLSPVDAVGSSLGPNINPTDAFLQVTGADASVVKAFVLSLQDLQSGLLSTTIVKEAFTVKNGSSTLTEGRDYKFTVSGTGPATVRFEAIGIAAFPLGVYQIEAIPSAGKAATAGSFTGGRLTDRENNVAQGTTKFTITLSGAQAPTAVTAVAGDGEASISWDQPADDGGAAVTGYVIESSTNAGARWVTVVSDTNSTSTSTTLSGLTNNVTYMFRVAAITAAGQGRFSTASNSVSPGLPAPAKPNAAAATGSVTLAWTAPAGAVGIQSYAVEESTDGGKTWKPSTFAQPANPGAADLATTVTGLANGSSYIFHVAAVSTVGQGNWSLASDPVLLMAAPTNLVATGGDGQVTLAWTAAVVTGTLRIEDYVVQVSRDGGTTWSGISDQVSTATTTTVSLPNGVACVFRVAAKTAQGQGEWSAASAAVTPLGPASPPFSVLATAGDAEVDLTWTMPISNGGSTITDYIIERSIDGGASWTRFADGESIVTAATVTGLANGTRYVFRVTAVTSYGPGTPSAASARVMPIRAATPPLNLVATAGDGQASLSWRVPTSNGGSAITDYVIQTSTNGGATWTDFVDSVSTTTTATVTRLTNGTSHVFRVAAKTGQGQGEWSSTSAAVTPLGRASAPLSVRGTAGDAKVDLTWTVPASNGGATITDYIVESSSDAGVNWTIFTDGESARAAATVTGLTNGRSYLFRVTAVTSFGQGVRSVSSSAVIPVRPASAPLALGTTVGDGQILLNWTAPASNGGATISDYAVQRSTDGGRTWTDFVDGVSTATTATVTGLANGTSHVFRVAARTSVGLGDWTAASAAVTPLSLASAPRSLQAVARDGQVLLTWTAPAFTSGSPVTDYLVQRSENGGSTWTNVVDGVSAGSGATVTGLANGTTYVFRVAAVTAAGPGTWSSATTGVVPKGPASAPLNVLAVGGNGQASLSWSAPSTTGGATIRDYVVQSSSDGGRNWSTTVDGVSASTGATLTGLNNGTNYTFRVAALTDFTTGTYSAASAAVMPLAAPGAVVGLQVLPVNGQFNLSWRAPVSTGGRPVSDYTVEYRASGTAVWVPWVHAASAATTASIAGLSANAGYLFRVRAVTSFASGQPVETTAPVVLMQPPTTVTGRAGNGIVALTWLPPRTVGPSQIIDYRVQYSVDGVNWTTAVDGVSAASRATVRGLANGTSYVFRVAAITAKGMGAYSTVSARLAPRAG